MVLSFLVFELLAKVLCLVMAGGKLINIFMVVINIRKLVIAVKIAFFSKCQKVPRGHHPVSQSRVYQDSKNAIKRCMDLKTGCSHKSSFYSRTSTKSNVQAMVRFL